MEVYAVILAKTPEERERDARMAAAARESLEKKRAFDAIDKHLKLAFAELRIGSADGSRLALLSIEAARAALRLHFDGLD